MLVDNINNDDEIVGKHSLPSNALRLIIESIKNTYEDFIKTLETLENKELNEDGFTQIFVKQNIVHLQKLNFSSMYIGVQYRDIYHKTKGIPDIYYSFTEQGKDYEPTFIMEAKRLPSPSKKREKEYVFGKTPLGNPNGGIERFKLGKHGLGLKECGLLAFIEKNDNEYWLNQVNFWIIEISENDSSWNPDEILFKDDVNFKYFHSNVLRVNSELKLYHFWIKIK